MDAKAEVIKLDNGRYGDRYEFDDGMTAAELS